MGAPPPWRRIDEMLWSRERPAKPAARRRNNKNF